MNALKTRSIISAERARRGLQSRFFPIRSLTPESLARQLDEFQAGNFRLVAQTWDAIQRRDDVLQGVASKRKKAVARLGWEVLTIEDTPEAETHRRALEFFYKNLTTTSAVDQNQKGGLVLLIEQMMDSVGKKYAVHEIVWNPVTGQTVDEFHGRNDEDGEVLPAQSSSLLTATFRFVPLWFFENRTGRLRFLEKDSSFDGVELDDDAWLVTMGDGLMESCSVAYLYKNLPLRDWLIYSERNGMPGVKGVTDALPGSTEWDQALEAVEDFGAEFHALMGRGTEIEAIDLTARGELPYPKLVERMDKAIIALWRGADLSTLSASSGVGASVQKSETQLIEHHDARIISETLNTQVDRVVIKYLFGTEHVKACIQLKLSGETEVMQDLRIVRQLWEMGTPMPLRYLYERFRVPPPQEGEALLNHPRQLETEEEL